MTEIVVLTGIVISLAWFFIRLFVGICREYDKQHGNSSVWDWEYKEGFSK